MTRNINTEELICQKLIEMMETTPIYKIKVTNFVEFAGISRSSFYVYFDSIYAVLQKIEDDFFDGLSSEEYLLVMDSYSGKAGTMNPVLIRKVEYLKNNIDLLRVLTGPNGDPSYQARLANRTWRLFKEKHKNCKAPKAQMRLACEYMCGGQWNLYRYWTTHEDQLDVYEMADMLERLARSVGKVLYEDY